MIRYILSPEAKQDIEDIARYLTDEAGVSVARRIATRLATAMDTLGRVPGLGHRRTDLTG